MEFINHIKEIPSTEGRNALMALFRRSPTEAESILLASGLTWRCIKMWIDLFNWDRALEVAMKYKQHVDTVLYYRQKYLTALDKSEKNTRFLQLANEVISLPAVDSGYFLTRCIRSKSNLTLL